MENQTVQVIERTAKRWKKWEAHGVMTMLLGLGLWFHGGDFLCEVSAATVLLMGIGAMIYAWCGGWWHHG